MNKKINSNNIKKNIISKNKNKYYEQQQKNKPTI